MGFGLEHPRCNWWAGTGTGKTSSGIELFDYARMFGEANRMLVLSTKRVCRDVWPKEVRKWENFHHLSVAAAIGTAEQRLAALRANAHITTCNYDNLPWLIDTVGEDHWPWDMVIADESVKLKSLRIDIRSRKDGSKYMRKSGGGERAQRIARVAHKKVRRWINATGLASPNGLLDLWGQQWYVDGGTRLGRTFSAYQERWFNAVRGSDGYQILYKPTPFAEEQIKAAIRDVTITIEAKDYFDLPPTIYNKILVPLPPEAYARYREMEREMFTTIKDYEIEAFASGGKTMKCRQLASGAAYTDDKGNWVEVHDAKLDALEDIITETAEPLIVAYQFKSDLARLKARFKHGREFDDNPKTLADFCAGKIDLLFLHPASAAHGIDEMQNACRQICFFSQTWSLDEFVQALERIGATRQAQAGLYRDVYVHMLIGENTIEEDMVERLDSKASVEDSIKQAMKKRG